MSEKYTYVKNNHSKGHVNPLVRKISQMIIQISWIISPVFVKRVLLRQFFAPRAYKTTAVEEQLLQQADQFSLKVHDNNIRCWRWGNGPAVIFAHGWNGRGIQFNSFFSAFIAGGYTVIVFDGPGHGASDGKTSSYFEMSDTVRAVLKFCKNDDIRAVIGHSFGASAIINALSKDKYDISAVLIAPAMDIKGFLDQAFLIHGVPEQVYRNLIREYENRFGYNLMTDNPKELIQNYSQNTLIIHDRDDRITPVAESIEYFGQSEYVHLHITEGLGHKRILNDQEVITASLEFITEKS
jgi:pimeloyl-ACP methyl ester carboxylesterase